MRPLLWLVGFFCTATLIGVMFWITRADGVEAKETASGQALLSGVTGFTESGDVIVLEHEDSPGKLTEMFDGAASGELPEQWSISAWKGTNWWFVLTLFRGDDGVEFGSSMLTQRVGLEHSAGDMYWVADTDEDGIVDNRMISFGNADGKVRYTDLNMDGYLDFMQIEDSTGTTSHILLDGTWTMADSRADEDCAQYNVTIGGQQSVAEFQNGKWIIKEPFVP